jgi:hypothetical protein
MPQNATQEAEATGAGIMAVAETMSTVLLHVVESNALLQMGAGFAQLPQPQERFPKHPVGGDQQRRVVLVVGQGEELLAHVACLQQTIPDIIKPPQTNKHLKELLGVLKLLTQLPCAGVSLFDRSGSKPASRNQRRAQRAVKLEFFVGKCVSVWQRCKHL